METVGGILSTAGGNGNEEDDVGSRRPNGEQTQGERVVRGRDRENGERDRIRRGEDGGDE